MPTSELFGEKASGHLTRRLRVVRQTCSAIGSPRSEHRDGQSPGLAYETEPEALGLVERLLSTDTDG